LVPAPELRDPEGIAAAEGFAAAAIGEGGGEWVLSGAICACFVCFKQTGGSSAEPWKLLIST